MGRTVKSQWEFGDLFDRPAAAQPALPAPPAARRVLTVAELTAEVKRLLERELGQVWVTGEVSNLRVQASGHSYFTLKDSAAQLSCVLFRGTPTPHRELLVDGLRLILLGDLTVYEPRGQYQLVVRQLELQGVGALQLAFERLKQKLQTEGLFAPERKRPLPRCPQRVGLVTSPTGAAIRDVLHVVRRRNPGLEIILAPCRVQGEDAAVEIATALAGLNAWSRQEPATRRLDLILVTRGGGSIEDLWAFNEEVVARAIAASAIPVVSAVGHEIDFTISDFVADLRAATPSAAAELITEGVFSSREFVGEARVLLGRAVRDRLESSHDRVAELGRRLERAHPRRRVNDQLQRLDDLKVSLARVTRLALANRLGAWGSLWQRWLAFRPADHLRQRRDQLRELQRRLDDQFRLRLAGLRMRLQQAEAGLRLLSPGSVLSRGYSITTEGDSGRVLRNAGEIRTGQRLRTRLCRGDVESVATRVTPDSAPPGAAAG